ncbi:MAG: N-acetylneuraminate synthase family protein [Candidatus Omnitrophota bacterium]
MVNYLKNLKDFGFKTDKKRFIIAEIGINHNGDIDTAKRLIDSASASGVDAVKFQTYITEKRVSEDSPIFDILKKCELPFEAFENLKKHSKSCNVDFLSTPFDNESVDYLESIGVDLYKIASFDVTNHQFLRKVAALEKGIILSVGLSDLSEIEDAYNVISEYNKRIALLHCISAYPTEAKDANLGAICIMKERFDCVIGHSDHTDGIRISEYAAVLGAQVIEKHYMISDDMECVDAPVSITEKQMKALVESISSIDDIIGEYKVKVTKAQEFAKIFRRYSK